MSKINAESSSNQGQRSLVWLILWPLAVLLRMSNTFGVFVDGQVFLYATDPYYHLRRIILAFNNFPHVLDKDIYLNFPNGAPTHWPFGFDIIMAAIISLLTLGQADSWWIEAIGALLPALIGGLLPLVIYLVALDLSDQFTALIAGILSALLPMTIHYAQIGNLDHHFLAALCQGLFWLTYLRASQKQEKSNLWAILAGLVLLIGFTSTTEFPFVILIHCIYLFVVWFTFEKRRDELILINLKIFLSVTVFLLPCVFTRYFEPNGVSPLIACSWLGCFAFSIFLSALATGKKLVPYSFSAIIIVLAIIFTMVFDFSLIGKLLAEFEISQGNTVIARLIKENDPIIFAGLNALLYWQSGFLLLV
ncbi:MAG: dolichyl-diphosphooligosaccharide--protein glycosyltransferase, partial [bacterium]